MHLIYDGNNDPICEVNILTAMASKITPKNFLMPSKPAGPKILAIRPNESKTIYTIPRLTKIEVKITALL